MALRDMVVRGEIRTAVEYLVQLLGTKEFIDNTIDTSWLDGIIKRKQLTTDTDPQLVVMSAAVFKAHRHVERLSASFKENFEKGQLSVQGIEALNTFPIEITYRDVKYEFTVNRLAPGIFRLEIGGTAVEAKVCNADQNCSAPLP